MLPKKRERVRVRMEALEGVMQQTSSTNYIPLTPISFLERAATLHPHTTSVIHAHLTFTWNLTYQRCTRLASALSTKLGISPGHYVAAVAPNIPELYEVHFGVPMAGGVLSTMNPRFDATTLSLIMEQLQPKIIFVDQQYLELLLTVFNLLDEKLTKSNTTWTWPLFVLINSKHHHACRKNKKLPPNSLLYEELLDMGGSHFNRVWPKSECDPILVNYTSGSTGNPKGVVYSHRAVYLNALGEILRSDLRDERVVFLWTADMFRANGWGFTWAIAALGGTNVFPDPHIGILGSISLHGVTHLSGHPTILVQALEEAPDDEQVLLPHKVYAHIAGVLPPSDMMLKIKEMGFQVVHRYGMTEVLGPPVNRLLWACETMSKPAAGNMMDQLMEQVDVKNPDTMESVPCDGQTMGEVMFRGNALMTEYLKAPSQTESAFQGGWFHTQDMAVKHQDGRIQLKDRAHNMINVSKRQGVSSLEIEAVLKTHPKILEAAVVGMPKITGDEVPCAFVNLKNGVFATQGEIVQFCRERLPSEMTPRRVVFGNLATNSSGKVKKFILREIAKEMSSQRSAVTNFV